MSEPKLISPMLDGFVMGGPISDHDGVRCCPAMRKDSDDKYIVKIISVPASQTKLDALLLTGAYPDKSSALAYFEELAKGIVDEKKILDDLAHLEGFIAYEDCQIVPMEDGCGFDVYLLGRYGMTLDRYTSKNNMTQLAAVNLGLDLCAGLAVCRRSGYMCVDLKPSNIFVVGDKEFRIGDLGFVRLDSLKYESLPDKYRSCYTAPEAEDIFATLSNTVDIYAAGLILYKVFNGGALPFTGDHAPNEAFEAPAYADEEIASIILKACSPDPSYRWQDPVEMGQAIVNYMQKNGVNETPLIEESFATVSETKEEILTDVTEETVVEENICEAVAEDKVSETVSKMEIDEVPECSVGDNVGSEEELDLSNIIAKFTESEDNIQEIRDETQVGLTQEDSSEQEENDIENLSFLDDIDETLLDDDYTGVTDEVSEILSQVDTIASYEVPEPVIAPEPVEVSIPDSTEAEEELADNVTDEENVDDILDSDLEIESKPNNVPFTPINVSEAIPEEEMPYVPKKKRSGLIWVIVILILASLAVGGYFFYTNYYLQPVHSLELTGSEDRLQVQLAANIDEALLHVVCSDPHGNQIAAPVVDGTAIFSGLTADTAYTVSVEVDGFHKLTGVTSKVYSTPLQTKIAQMSAITGTESGSVILSFTVEGPDSEQWNVIYNAEGEAERVTTFPSHMVTLTGRTVGKEYAFRLEPVDDIYLSEEAEIMYVARSLVYAENLQVTTCNDGILEAQWSIPDGTSVSNWSVRCYNDAGYDEVLNVTDNLVAFEGIDDTAAYTIEVTAAEMSVSQRVQIGENSITVSDFSVNDQRTDMLQLSWSANRDIPAEGWTVRYTINGVAGPTAINTRENGALIPVIPNSTYVFSIFDGAGNPVLGGPFTYTHSGMTAFSAYSVTKNHITARLCKTPSSPSWSYKNLSEEDYTNSFAAGQKISMVLACSADYDNSEDNISITFAIYDENDNLISFSHLSQTWQSMWYENYCELDISGVPTEPGTYNAVVFFNGAEAGSQKFEVTV